MGFKVEDFEFRVSRITFRVSGCGFLVSGIESRRRVSGFENHVSGLGLRFFGFGSRVAGFWFRVSRVGDRSARSASASALRPLLPPALVPEFGYSAPGFGYLAAGSCERGRTHAFFSLEKTKPSVLSASFTLKAPDTTSDPPSTCAVATLSPPIFFLQF